MTTAKPGPHKGDRASDMVPADVEFTVHRDGDVPDERQHLLATCCCCAKNPVLPSSRYDTCTGCRRDFAAGLRRRSAADKRLQPLADFAGAP